MKVRLIPLQSTVVDCMQFSWMYWSAHGKTIMKHQGRYKLVSHGLLIKDAQESDTGTYICEVESNTLMTAKEITLTVVGWYYETA